MEKITEKEYNEAVDWATKKCLGCAGSVCLNAAKVLLALYEAWIEVDKLSELRIGILGSMSMLEINSIIKGIASRNGLPVKLEKADDL